VKAQAYGHGAVAISQFLQNLAVRHFAVATVEEGMELRQNGIDSEILLLCGVPPSQERVAAEHELTIGIHSLEECKRLAALGLPFQAHLNYNSGMNRLGLSDADLSLASQWIAHSNVRITGAYSHFSSADELDETFSRLQLERFKSATSGRGFVTRHLASSGGLRFPEAWFDLVRVGLILYGYNPIPERLEIDVRPVLSWKVRALQIQDVPAGTPISYLRTFVTDRPARLAALAVGYADGFSRKLSNAGYVLAGGKACRVLGTVTMDMTVVDVTAAEADLQTEFAIIDDRRDAAGLASELGTVPYEVLCAVGARVARIYV
jgi:alanine racemase